MFKFLINKKLWLISITFLVSMILSFILYSNYYVNQLVKLTEPQLLTIEQGTSFHHFTKQLVKQKVIKDRFWLRNYVRMNSSLAQIKAGTYLLEKSDTIKEFLLKVHHGKEHQFSITFIEGSTLKEWLTILRKHPRINHTLTEMGTGYHAQYKEVSEKLELAIEYPEGVFFPETYAFVDQTTDVALLQRANKKMQQELDHAWQNRSENLPYDTAYQALIMASIIEKESGLHTEHELISSVFVNRLYKGMRLQTDPTIIYGLGERYKGDIKRKHKREKTAYNTYRINGLPPTPIAMPSKAALHAALNPVPSEYLYFVSNGAGKHIFSTNLVDHNKAVVKYQLNRP